ncbi:MAG: class I SAM-dependent methyltransferase [Alphaproteobacteria bacterium]|nr:class I SAM-dependent methyltransferase [Alphaproteobacteria bacterium]MBU1514501.1 class I SAM-dependent methyltransferase [Alphaproteobacteria bacterium]MBU2096867.1 class I SAM-dependent methyltransferase [Alphaproteobacteria bacterium]MBU2153494.1 class I SAM-dependent methyltransferase [Alphaproteobacteria bacterium]MBU2306001.1 class I SAM-dependent methyltransferase [Alphaproteobacteria bacterium]
MSQTDTPVTPQDAPLPRRPLDGPAYRDFIADVVRKKFARNYLEVGVRDGKTLAGIDCPTIGVDPNFTLSVDPIRKKRVLHLYQMTSDEFFRDHDPRAVLGSPVDVAFLDGLHVFEYLLRDFINTERVCDRNSLILLDDCMPVNIEMTERVHRPELRKDKAIAGWWTGDVWKVVSILRELRPELRITPVSVRPTGSIMVSNLDPTSTVLDDRYFEIIERYRPMVFTEALYADYWTTNAPVPASAITEDFNLSLFARV